MASLLDTEIFEEETLGVGSNGKVCRDKCGQSSQSAHFGITWLNDKLKKMKQKVVGKAKFNKTGYEELVERHKEEREGEKDVNSKQDVLESTVVPGCKCSVLQQLKDREQPHLAVTRPKLVSVPDYKAQKKKIRAALRQRLKIGDIWYLVDGYWMLKWKKYVGYDRGDQSLAGQDSANPGPLDNSNLLKDNGTLKDDLERDQHYCLLPESAWHKLRTWYGTANEFQPIPRKVVEDGLRYTRYCMVEVYLLEFKLCLYSNENVIVVKEFSRADTIALLESEMRKTFSVAVDEECRVWHRQFFKNTYELLSDSSRTLVNAGLYYSGQTIALEVRNKDGTWPWSTKHLTNILDNNMVKKLEALANMLS